MLLIGPGLYESPTLFAYPSFLAPWVDAEQSFWAMLPVRQGPILKVTFTMGRDPLPAQIRWGRSASRSLFVVGNLWLLWSAVSPIVGPAPFLSAYSQPFFHARGSVILSSSYAATIE